MRKQLILIVAAAIACAPKPQPAPVAAPVTTAPKPAAVSAETLEGIDFQNNWIFDRYGRFRRTGGGIAHAGEGSATRRYEVVKIELADHSQRTVYFDITENEKTWDRQH
jgi:hypothetical protein